MDVLELFDTKTLKLINSASSYTFQETKDYYLDRDYTDDFKKPYIIGRIIMNIVFREIRAYNLLDTSL